MESVKGQVLIFIIN